MLLAAKGYRVRHRNWRGGGGELDLVAERRREIVFVEVKARSSDLYGGAVAAPLFSSVMSGALRLMNVAPDDFQKMVAANDTSGGAQ